MSIESPDEADLLRSAQELGRFSRRNLLKLGALGAIQAFYEIDMRYTESLRQRQNRVTVMPISGPEVARQHPDSAWFLMPGLNLDWSDSHHIGKILERSLVQTGQVNAVGYSSEGFDREDVYTEVTDYAHENNIRDIYMIGHSTGGLIAMECTSLIKQRRDDMAVKLVTLDHTPTGRDSVLKQNMLRTLAVTAGLNIDIPTTGRAGLEVVERGFNKGERDTATIIREIGEELGPDSASTKLVQSLGRYIWEFDESRISNLPDDLIVVMLSNLNDTTIDQRMTRREWRRILQDKLKMTIDMDGTVPAHASIEWNGDRYREEFNTIQHCYLGGQIAKTDTRTTKHRER